jgi:aminoglycoside phosphotransferase (APT) family kinase protein
MTDAPTPAGRPGALDCARLGDWLRTHVEGFRTPFTVSQFPGGQSNPTYLIDSAGGRYVLRRKPGGKLLPSAHAVEREFRVIAALGNTRVPVARARSLCADESVIGTVFYVMDYVEGRIFWDDSLPELPAAERRPIYTELNRVLAALHGVDFIAAGLGDYGKPGQYVERQVARWTKQYRASQTEAIHAMDHLIEWLPRHVPPEGGTCIVHGDYRLDNVIFHPREPRILAVIDWELSTLGSPLVELAYLCVRWHMPAEEFRALGGLDLANLEIPTESEFVAEYCRRRGLGPVAPETWAYYLAFNMFRLAAILQGVLARALQGNASSTTALEAGRRARPLAELAARIVRQSFGTG